MSNPSRGRGQRPVSHVPATSPPQLSTTRFAPSPTGELHIGSVRTALFAWLHARQQHGSFLLRIEDTDRERSTDENVQGLLHELQWLGLTWDGQASSQVGNHTDHVQAVQELLANGNAYYDQGTAADTAAWRQAHPGQGYRGQASADDTGAVRLRLPDSGEVRFTDMVQGEIVVPLASMDDPVICRADGTPTFLLANAVDDQLQGVELVIRGDDHLSNTPKQILLLQGLGRTVPTYAHVPLLLDEQGKKFSKRSVDSSGKPLAVSSKQLREEGFLPQAVLSYVSRLGWGTADDQPMSVEELQAQFNITDVKQSPARWDNKKLLDNNYFFLRELPEETYAQQLADFRGDAVVTTTHRQATQLAQPKSHTLREAQEMTAFLFRDHVQMDDASRQKWLGAPDSKQQLTGLAQQLQAVNDWDHDHLLATCRQMAAETDTSLKKLMQAGRVATLGHQHGPDLTASWVALGKERTLQYLQETAATLS